MLGYIKENPYLTEDDVVPPYRTVVGFHSDAYGRRLELNNPRLSFINEDRLRNSVSELEKMEQSDVPIVIQDLEAIEIIRKHLKVEVHKFTFSPIMVAGVINAIRGKLEDWLYDLEKDFAQPNLDENKQAKVNYKERQQLRLNLQDHFSETELREICFDFHIDYESLTGRGKREKIMEIVLYFERRGLLFELIETCRKLRPHILWS